MVDASKVVGIVIAVLIGIVAGMQVIGSEYQRLTGTTHLNNISVATVNGSTIDVGRAFLNQTETISNDTSSSITLTRDVNYTTNSAAGTITFIRLNESAGQSADFSPANTSDLAYSYRDSDYLTNTTHRDLLGIVVLLFVLIFIVFIASRILG